MNCAPSNLPPEPFALACACKLGRILGGHDCGVPRWPLPALPTRSHPDRLQDITNAHILKVLDECNGKKSEAARRLDIMRHTLDSRLARMKHKAPANVIRLVACLVVFCASLANAQMKGAQFLSRKSGTQEKTLALPALPKRSLTATLPTKTNGVVTLKWNNGDPAETTIVNQTSGIFYPSTVNETLTVGGLPVGTKQTFVATTTAGASLPASVTVTADSMTIQYTTWLYLTWPGPAGILQRTTNLVIWQDVQPIASGGSVLITNKLQRGEFYRVKL